MFLSVRQYAQRMTQLPRLKVKFTGQGHVIYLSIRPRPISPESFERFALNLTQMFLSVRWCAEHMTQLPRFKVKVTGQGQGIYHLIWCPLHISGTLWTVSLNFTQMFLSVRRYAEHMTQHLDSRSRSQVKVI